MVKSGKLVLRKHFRRIKGGTEKGGGGELAPEEAKQRTTIAPGSTWRQGKGAET